MSVDFPPLCPTQRSYTPGNYPTKNFSALNGASVTRLYGSRAYDAEMTLTFVLSDLKLEQLLASWHSSYGGAEILNLPPQVFGGVSSELQGQIPSYLNWRWAETPSVESLIPGRSRVQVKLTATLDA